MKEKLFSVSKDEFRIDYYRGSGAGGQHRNKTSNCARVTYVESGAVGQSQDGRSQTHNRETAFLRCTESQVFQTWLKLKIAAVIKGYSDIDRMIDEQMREENIKVKYGAC